MVGEVYAWRRVLGAVLEIDTRGFLKELAGRRSTPSARSDVSFMR